MAAYLIGQIQIKDNQLWQEYVVGVSDSLLPFDATVVFRGARTAVLSGENDRELVVVIKFTDHRELEDWFNSEQYQSLVSLRDSAADVVITTYESY